ncbi:MAG: hypothetical protein GC154_02780 [bacterium]|nr:hypothetical protein [bacterium]
MPAKPSANTILSTYSLDELLALVKDKATMEADEKIQPFRNAVESFTQSVSGAVSGAMSQPKRRGRKPGRPAGTGKRGRPPGTGKRGRPAKAGAPRGKRAAKSLKDFLLEVLGKEPQGVEAIMKGLQEKGYKSKSKDPRRVLYLELKKQVDKGLVKKSGRGLYALK